MSGRAAYTVVGQVNEIKLGREVKLQIGDLGGLTSQLTLPSFGKDIFFIFNIKV